MSIDFRNNISGQLYNMGAIQISAQTKTSAWVKVAEEIGLLVVTLPLLIPEAAVRFLAAMVIKYSVNYLVALPIAAYAGCRGGNTCKKILKYFVEDFNRFIAIVQGTLYTYEWNRTKQKPEEAQEALREIVKIHQQYPWVTTACGNKVVKVVIKQKASQQSTSLPGSG